MCSLEKEKQAKGDDSTAQPLLEGTQHRDLDEALGVVTDGALDRLLESDGKDPEQEILEQLAVKYEHGEGAWAASNFTVSLLWRGKPCI